MTSIQNKDLPPLFFIPKYQSLNGYCLQLLECKDKVQSINNFLSDEINVSHYQDISSSELFHCSLIGENYWYLPYEIASIPILDFQYLSWTPSYYKPICIINNSIFDEFFEIRNLNLIQLQYAIRYQPILNEPSKAIPIKEFPLPTHVFEALLRDAKVGKECCPISMTSYSECEALSITSCFHIFEKNSIEQWFNTKTSCPVCRKESKIIA